MGNRLQIKEDKMKNSILSMAYDCAMFSRLRDFTASTFINILEKYIQDKCAILKGTYVMNLNGLLAFRAEDSYFFFSDSLYRIGCNPSFVKKYEQRINVFNNTMFAVPAFVLDELFKGFTFGTGSKQSFFILAYLETMMLSAKMFDELNDYKTNASEYYISTLFPKLYSHSLDIKAMCYYVSNRKSEDDTYFWFRSNWEESLKPEHGWRYKSGYDQKGTSKNRPDIWMTYNGEDVPVECKHDKFGDAALKQLLRYMKAFHSKYGIAVGSSCDIDLPNNILFIKCSAEDISTMYEEIRIKDVFDHFVFTKDRWSQLKSEMNLIEEND